MDELDGLHLMLTGKLPATSETFISPSLAYAARYNGVLAEFEVRAGTLNALEALGVRDVSRLVRHQYSEMPVVSSGWSFRNAFFKGEDEFVNIGLGRGPALDVFNSNIVRTRVIDR